MNEWNKSIHPQSITAYNQFITILSGEIINIFVEVSFEKLE